MNEKPMDTRDKTIEELRQIIEDLVDAKVRAEEGENKYKQIFDNTLDHIFILDVTDDKQFKYADVNPSQAKETGELRPGSLVRDCLSEEAYYSVISNYNRCLEEQRIISYEETFYNRDFLTQLIPLKDANGDVFRIVGIARNITNEKMLYRQLMVQNERLRLLNTELTKAKEKAEESDKLKSAFLHNMSHEIRTPMNAIVGFSQLLINCYNDKEKLELFTGIINQRCDDLLVIIDEILDIARIESGQLKISIEKCNLSSLFDELQTVFKEHQSQIEKQHIRFSLQAGCDVSKLVVATDKVKLKQIFTNLLENAFKFTDEGSVEGGCITDSNNDLVFYVADTGIGIPVEKQQVIFDRFIQLQQNPDRIYGGAGLGLSIVKGLVTLLGGRIWLESELGKGTCFYFTIPLHPEIVAEHEPVNLQKDENTGLLKGKTILVVEDDTYNAEYINEVLSNSGSNIIHARFGKEAVEIADSLQLDLVLMDIGLPDINGYEVTRQIKQQHPDLKIIAQTAYAASEDKQKSIESGCVDYISKPLKSKTLLSVMNRHLSV